MHTLMGSGKNTAVKRRHRFFSRLAWIGLALGLGLELGLGGSPALACFAPPASLTVHHTDLVAETKVIVLARVIGATDKPTYNTLGDMQANRDPNRALAKFEAIEVLRGKTPPEFSLSGGSLADVDYDPYNDFDGHKSALFWDKKITRQWNQPDCQMHPDFQVGRTYLLFVDHPHWRAYEEIRGPDDLWLQAVRRSIEDPSLPSGLSLSLDAWLALSHGVFVGRVQSCDGPTLSVDEVLHGKFDSTWRYSNEEDAGYWPDGTCEIGRHYLIVAYQEEPEILPHYSASVFPVHDGLLDFGAAFRDSDIEVQAFRIQKLDDVRRRMKSRTE